MTKTAGSTWLKLRSHDKGLPVDPSCPFPVGVEYYRPPMPPPDVWEEDLKRIREAGLRIVRTFYPWNWAEPLPGGFEFDDLDRLFDLAGQNGLKVWVDTPVGTHMACPEWMIREHPDMAAVRRDGSVQHPVAGEWAPHGAMIHNFDHLMWRAYVERYLRALVPRYKDHPAMGIWGTWDGINFAAAWSGGEGYPPYNDYTIEKYKNWLRRQFALDQLNERLMRRYRTWNDVEPPRSNDAVVEMMLYRRFHYENMADHLGWIADLIDRLDGRHEQRSHGGSYPRPLDEIVSPHIDSWGLSHHSADRLTSDDPYSLASECFGFQWCRTVGRNNRWWNEEIYGSFVGGLAPREKRTIPEESAAFLWLTLIEGAAGAMFWQYRPEYMTFEGPGLSIVGLDGEPTARWPAVKRTIAEIDSIAPHLPLSIPRAELAIAYSGSSHEVFDYGRQNTLFLQQLRGMYRTLWSHSIAMDIVTPASDWSAFKAIYLPNFALLDDVAITRIRDGLQDAIGPRLIADGHLGTFAGKGHWSLHPPEGLTDVIDARIVDFDMINERDLREGKSILVTDFGEYPIVRPCQYAILEPRGDMRPIATLGDDIVAVRSADGRFTWFGLSLSATASTNVPGQPAAPPPAGIVHAELALALVRSAGVGSRFTIEGDPIVAFRRGSKLGGSLIFLLNVERRTAHTSVTLHWPVESARDLLNEQDITLRDGAFEVEMAFGNVRVIHCVDR